MYSNLKIIIVDFSILDLITNDIIDIKKFNGNAYIRIPLISFDYNIFNTNILYKSNASSCYYDISISDDGLELLDKKIVSNSCGSIMIKRNNNVDTNIFRNIVIILKPSDIKLGKININN